MNPIEPRTMFGYPIIPSKLDLAKQYAAQVRERRSQACTCSHCMQQEKLETVQRIAQNWSKP